MPIDAPRLMPAGSQYGDHMDWDDGSGWWMAIVMIAFGLSLLGVIVWAVVTITKSHHAAPARESSARMILDERFARGEIDGTEYEERRRLLQS